MTLTCWLISVASDENVVVAAAASDGNDSEINCAIPKLSTILSSLGTILICLQYFRSPLISYVIENLVILYCTEYDVTGTQGEWSMFLLCCDFESSSLYTKTLKTKKKSVKF